MEIDFFVQQVEGAVHVRQRARNAEREVREICDAIFRVDMPGKIGNHALGFFLVAVAAGGFLLIAGAFLILAAFFILTFVALVFFVFVFVVRFFALRAFAKRGHVFLRI